MEINWKIGDYGLDWDRDLFEVVSCNGYSVTGLYHTGTIKGCTLRIDGDTFKTRIKRATEISYLFYTCRDKVKQ